MLVLLVNKKCNFSKATTDVGKDKCSNSHGGTSAAAPNAVGIFALALSARFVATYSIGMILKLLQT